jgi:hypothetical protein
MIHGNIITDLGSFTDNNPHAVINEELTADPGARVNLNAGDEAGYLRGEPTKKKQLMNPAPVGEPMEPDGVQARITEEHLNKIARSWITVKNRIYVFFHPGKHAYPLGTSTAGFGLKPLTRNLK